MAISTGAPFPLVNKQVFENKKWEEYASRFFYSEIGLAILKFFCKMTPGLIDDARTHHMGFQQSSEIREKGIVKSEKFATALNIIFATALNIIFATAI